MRRSYKTLEFWMSAFAMFVGDVMASGILEETATDIDNKLVGMIATTLAALGYTVGRSWQKASEKKHDALVSIAKDGGKPPVNP